MQHDYGHFEEDQLGKPYDIRLMRRLWPFVRPYRRWLVLTIALVIVLTFLDLSMPYITKIAIDRYIVPQQTSSDAAAEGDGVRPYTVRLDGPDVRKVVERHPNLFRVQGGQATIPFEALERLSPTEVRTLRREDLSGVGMLALLLLVVTAAHFGINFVQMMIMEYAGQMVMHDLRMRLFNHLQGLSVAFFSRQPVARLVTRVTNDVQNMYELFTSVIVFIFKDLFLLVGITAVLMAINWRLSLVTFTVLPLVLAASMHFAGLARDAFRELRIKVAEINARFSETISGIKVIQLFGEQEPNYRRFTRLNHENYLAGMRQIHVFAVFMPVIELLSAVALATIIWYGGGRVVQGTLSLGELVAFISYIRMFFRPIRDISEKYNVMQNAMASAERIFLLLDNKDGLRKPDPARPDPGFLDGEPLSVVQLDRVSFSYNPGEPVLQDIQMELRRGETLAVVGPTGSGKTTLMHLLLRFYEPDEGRILFNGRDIGNADPQAVRERTALVTQDPFLFTASIADNLRFGNPDLDEAGLRQVLESAQCAEWVRRLPDGIETVLSEGGQSVSSGERQLLSIARAMARDAELIILDEATSYVDSETEERVQAALGHLIADRTAILVAHRLSTARGADRIAVMHHGRIIESGTHAKLLENRGFYYRLYQLSR
ncbi:MAG: ABC transporter ATP-binding protein/permease [Desulfobacteraceae bacterium]|nr:ABC transporter ATP-binding protein/permease [Desulfobacteraceae bacterium]